MTNPLNRITIRLDDPIAIALDSWLDRTAAAVGNHLGANEAIAAMIITTLRYQDVADTVASQIRHQRASTPQDQRGLTPLTHAVHE